MNIPAIAIRAVTPEISMACPRGGGSAQQRRSRLCTAPPLLSLPPHGEERVVDADGHPNQEDHGGRRLPIGGVGVADERKEPERREHRGEREQDRKPARHDRAESGEEDRERERNRQPLGAREVLAELLAELVVRTGVADLAHAHDAVRGLRAGDRLEDRLDPVLRRIAVAADVELDEDGVAVA